MDPTARGADDYPLRAEPDILQVCDVVGRIVRRWVLRAAGMRAAPEARA